MDILCNRGVLTIGNAIFSKIPFTEVRGDDFQRSALIDRTGQGRSAPLSSAAAAGCDWPGAVTNLRSDRSCTTTGSRTFPLGDGKSLPCLFARSLFRPIKGQKARLSTGIKFHLQGVVILPRDVQPAGLAHDSTDSEGFALKAGGIIFRKIPGVRGA